MKFNNAHEFILAYIASVNSSNSNSSSSNKNITAFMLEGKAGVGKTYLTKLIAEELNAEYIFIQCTLGVSEEQFIYNLMPDQDSKSGIKVVEGKLTMALRSSVSKKVVLVIDEFDKTRPSADAFLLDFIQNARISWNFDGQTVVEGNPDNIIMFLTSNAMREFTEPLLRRVIKITIDAYTPHEMMDMLRRYSVCEEHLALLVQIYVDTLNAGLSKPATVQELVQLHHALHLNIQVSFEELLKMFIVKSDEDFQKYVEYVESQGKSRLGNWDVDDENNDVDIAKSYEGEICVNKSSSSPAPAPAPAPIPTLKVVTKDVDLSAGIRIENTDEEVYCMLNDDEYQTYTYIAREFKDHIVNDANNICGYERVNVNGKWYVIKRDKPLSFGEVKLFRNIAGEMYMHDRIYMTKEFVDRLIRYADKIKYYTNNKFVAVYHGSEYDSTYVFEKTTDAYGNTVYDVRGHIMSQGDNGDTMMRYSSQHNPFDKMFYGDRNYLYKDHISMPIDKSKLRDELKEIIDRITLAKKYNMSIVIDRKEKYVNYVCTLSYYVDDKMFDADIHCTTSTIPNKLVINTGLDVNTVEEFIDVLNSLLS